MKKLIFVLVFIFLCSGLPAQAFNGQCYDGGDTIGPWDVIYAGYGCVRTTYHGLLLRPQTSTHEDETHAALVVGPEFSNFLVYKLSLLTIAQLRQNSEPNPWEVAWVVWHYTDDDHFYYFIPKPNGWELGKRDPDYPGGQRYLATSSDVLFPIQQWYRVRVVQINNLIRVFVNNQLMVEFLDEEEPYTSGRIGLYDEDARVIFKDIYVAH